MQRTAHSSPKTVYSWYGCLRSRLELLAKSIEDGTHATDSEIAEIYDIIRGPTIPLSNGKEWQSPGLGSVIKDELGSYITAIVSATHSGYSEESRKLIQNPELLLKMREAPSAALGNDRNGGAP